MACVQGTLNVGVFGKVVMRFGVCEDITGSTPTLDFKKPDGASVQKTDADGVTIGSGDYTDEDTGEILLSGEYMQYTVEDGLLDADGLWSWRAIVETTSPLSLTKSDFQPLMVRP
jgi:hypothetical protein